jgi:hypothetical protein
MPQWLNLKLYVKGIYHETAETIQSLATSDDVLEISHVLLGLLPHPDEGIGYGAAFFKTHESKDQDEL